MSDIRELVEETLIEEMGVSFETAKALIRLLKAERTRQLVQNEGTAAELRKARSALKSFFSTAAEERRVVDRAKYLYFN